MGRACLIPYLGLLVPDPYSQSSSIHLLLFQIRKYEEEYRGPLPYHPSVISKTLILSFTCLMGALFGQSRHAGRAYGSRPTEAA